VTLSLTLLGRPGCHLCHDMRALVERLIRGTKVALVERNIEEDETLLRRYALLIPVLLAGEREIARYRIDEPVLRERLRELGAD
jgi:hypothetical protein